MKDGKLLMQNFYNNDAFDMCVWSYEEENRIKASKIYRVAVNMENRYRKFHEMDSEPYVTTTIIRYPKPEWLTKIKANKKKHENT